MKKISLVKNDDGSYCMDIYCNSIEDSDFLMPIAQKIRELIKKGKLKLRNYPFHFGVCSHCGQLIFNNRDSWHLVTCENCHTTFLLGRDESDEAEELAWRFNKAFGSKTHDSLGREVGIYVNVPKDTDEETLDSIEDTFRLYGFRSSGNGNGLLETTARRAQYYGWREEPIREFFAVRNLGEDEPFFNNTLPLVDECVRLLEGLSDSIHVLSIFQI